MVMCIDMAHWSGASACLFDLVHDVERDYEVCGMVIYSERIMHGSE